MTANFEDTYGFEADGRIATCPDHEGMRLPCIFSHDEATCNAIDQVIEEVAAPQSPTLLSLLLEWQDTCLQENRDLPNQLELVAYACPLLLRLSALGNRLIHQAHDVGMRSVMTITRDVLNGR